MMVFKKARRGQARLKLGITGPSGSGKTMSALRMALGIGSKIAVIDTENGSASLYADKFEFDTLNIEPPFTSDKYIQAIELAEKKGYEVIVVDSFSHAWAGEGGTLDKKSDLDARGGNKFSNWKNPKQEYAKLKNAILHSTSHIICCIRSKQAYVLVEENGKQKPQKMGLDPIAEPNIEYELTTVFELAMDHKAAASKDRTGLFDKQLFLITEETGNQLMRWLNEAKPEQAEQIQVNDTLPSTSPILCKACGAELVKHAMGLVCPNAKVKGDPHTRILTSQISEYQKQHQEVPHPTGGK